MAHQFVGEVLLLHPAAEVVGVFVIDTNAHLLGATIVSIHEMERDGPVRPGLLLPFGGKNAGAGAVALRRETDIEHRLGQNDLGFRKSHHFRCLGRGHRHLQGLGIRKAHIFRSADHDAPGNKGRLLAAIDHPRQVVQRRIRVAASHTFDESGNDIVMIVPILIVGRRSLTGHLGDFLRRQHGAIGEHGARLLQEIQSHPRVATGVGGNQRERLLAGSIVMNPQPPLLICQRPPKDRHDGLVGQRLQMNQPHTRKQRPVDFEIGILCGGADQNECAIFYIREQHILLALIEPMNFIDENNGAPAIVRKLLLRLGHHVTNILDTAGGGIHFHEMTLRHLRNHRSDGSLPAARRSEKEKRRDRVLLDHAIQKRPAPYGRLLPHDFIEPPRPHAIRQRRVAHLLLRSHIK